MELQASFALQTLATVKKQKQGKPAKTPAVVQEDTEEEEGVEAPTEGTTASHGTNTRSGAADTGGLPASQPVSPHSVSYPSLRSWASVHQPSKGVL